ncbi:dienelactone hydrolase family protein [Caenimonas sp. SL110]|uniref:dienelactone hydrolase family protein n=1 Tax=Caenimonas sp. SL110 TaxID=1450524 RepID=UPI0009E2C8EC|nr:dienelactone hydrolase family protein [Caenimonas sp. SL110]
MIEKHLDIATADGEMNSFVAYPESGGPHPVVLFYMDAPGKREELHDMARRLAAGGYYVVLPNLYYRRTRDFWLRERTEESMAVMFGHMDATTNAMAVSDTAALLAFVDAQPEADGKRIGAVGYCMSGPFVVHAAAAFPDRFASIASIHGAQMMTDRPDSPHRVASTIKCETYVGCAEIDKWAPSAHIDALEAAMKQGGVNYRIEWYGGAQHGFVFPQRAGVYDEASAERHWERLFDLFGRTLGLESGEQGDSMGSLNLKIGMPILKRLLWGPREERELIQGAGINVIPANFYSSIPSIAEVRESYEYVEGAVPYLDESIFDPQTMRGTLAELVPWSADFTPELEGDQETCRSYFWKNSQFSFSDSMSYWAFVRKTKPKTVVEIGSGFSSLVAMEALEKNGAGTLRCIEPYPRPFITGLASEGRIKHIPVRAQDVTPDMLNDMLEDGDILFIDSTHTVKSGSDCLHIYLRLLPAIRKKVLVHVHDVFLPFGMPQAWLLDMHIYWTEQYLLLAFLTDNPRARVLFGSAYNEHFNKPLLEDFMHGRFASGGGSFWFEYDGRR